MAKHNLVNPVNPVQYVCRSVAQKMFRSLSAEGGPDADRGGFIPSDIFVFFLLFVAVFESAGSAESAVIGSSCRPHCSRVGIFENTATAYFHFCRF
jgi:hypothetical protein